MATVPVFFLVDISRFNFEKQPVITKMYWWTLFVFKSGCTMAMAINSSGSVAKKNRCSCCCLLVWRLHERVLQSLTAPFVEELFLIYLVMTEGPPVCQGTKKD